MSDIFRKNYVDLLPTQSLHINEIKEAAEKLYKLLEEEFILSDPEMIFFAKIKLEECVMWATKAYTV